MPHNEKKLLWDLLHYCGVIRALTAGVTQEHYLGNEQLRLAVERAFEIVGEAIRQLDEINPDLAGRMGQYKGFIGLRNIIAHGYSKLDHRLIWQYSQEAVPRLEAAAATIYAELV